MKTGLVLGLNLPNFLIKSLDILPPLTPQTTRFRDRKRVKNRGIFNLYSSPK